MSYELRPKKTKEQMLPLVSQFVANFAKTFGEAPSPENISKWCDDTIIKRQEEYVKNYLEGFYIGDIADFPKYVKNHLTIDQRAKSNSEPKRAVI